MRILIIAVHIGDIGGCESLMTMKFLHRINLAMVLYKTLLDKLLEFMAEFLLCYFEFFFHKAIQNRLFQSLFNGVKLPIQVNHRRCLKASVPLWCHLSSIFL